MSHQPTPNSGFLDHKNRSFEQVVDPLVTDFIQKVLTNALNEYTVQLQPQQIQYIVSKIQTDLQNLRYDAKNDLGKMVNNLWRQGNSAAAINTPKDQTADTPLASQISDLFRRRK